MELRTLRDQDAEKAWELDRVAFHGSEENRERYLRWFRPNRCHGIFDGDRLVALGAVWDFGQFFGGRRVPMGGVSSIAVAPDQRGRGHARRILEALIAAMLARGEVISSLYPATTYLYRSLGWELAGAHTIRKIAPRRLRELPAPAAGRVRAGNDADFAAIRACYDGCATETNGFLDPGDRWWGSFREKGGREIYVAENDEGRMRGFLVYRQLDGEYSALGGPWGVRVDAFVAAERDAALGLWRLLGDWSSQVDQIFYRTGPEDSLFLLLPEQAGEVLADIRWMTRIVDAPGAVAQRGFAQALEASVDLEIRDPLVAANEGRFTLSVSKGRGRLERGGGGGLELDIGALSSIYTGWGTTSLLARAGRLQGGSAAARSALDAVFAGPTPWIPYEF